ncbi:DUF1799 domain-containing protein [Megalodesulfovibrio paquesii]
MAGGSGDNDPEKMAAQAAALGLPVELLAEADGYADVDVYPDNWPALWIFKDLATQWRVGLAGATGLDYAALPAVLDLRGVPQAERADLFDCLQVLEAETLTAWHEE